MDTRTIKLYDENELRLVKRKRAAALVIACVISVLTLAFCIICCITAGRNYSSSLLVTTIAASVLGSWAVLTLKIFLIDPLDCAAKHIAAMLENEGEPIEGAFELTDSILDIKKGVSLVRVKADTAEGRHETLSLYAKKRKLFEARRAKRVYSVMGFISAYEVENEGV